MTRRLVGVWARPTVDDPTLAAAMLEDVVDLVAGMEQVEGAVVAAESAAVTARAVAWPGMPVLTTPEDAGVTDGLAALAAAGADEGLLVLPDAPDLPPLLLGKLFSALTSWPVAVCPSSDGGLVAVAAVSPAPAWLADGVVTGDGPDALSRLRAAAPSRGLHVGAGWHRVRSAADVPRLDPGLEGWEATRAWVSRR
jgi:glycosyltransferase A (GT-A) superfamily protein (DUF2064 family)